MGQCSIRQASSLLWRMRKRASKKLQLSCAARFAQQNLHAMQCGPNMSSYAHLPPKCPPQDRSRWSRRTAQAAGTSGRTPAVHGHGQTGQGGWGTGVWPGWQQPVCNTACMTALATQQQLCVKFNGATNLVGVPAVGAAECARQAKIGLQVYGRRPAWFEARPWAASPHS